IPIDFERRIASLSPEHRLYPLLEQRLRVDEVDSDSALQRGIPSQRVIQFCHSSFGFVRIDRIRTLVLSVLISVFSVLFLLALLLGQAAETNLKGYRRLADVKLLADYIMAADELWPAYPEKISAMEAWLRKARELAHRLPVHQANLTKLRRRALS